MIPRLMGRQFFERIAFFPTRVLAATLTQNPAKVRCSESSAETTMKPEPKPDQNVERCKPCSRRHPDCRRHKPAWPQANPANITRRRFGTSVRHQFGPQHSSGPVGKARRIFEKVSQLPHRQQQRILATVEDMVFAQEAKA